MNQKALDKFVANVSASSGLLQSLTQYIDNHMEVDPDEVNWGHVGDSASLRNTLEELVQKFGLMPVEG